MVDPISGGGNFPQIPEGKKIFIKEFNKTFPGVLAQAGKAHIAYREDPTHENFEKLLQASSTVTRCMHEFIKDIMHKDLHLKVEVWVKEHVREPGMLHEAHEILSNPNTSEEAHIGAASLASAFASLAAGHVSAEANDAAEQVRQVVGSFFEGGASAADVAAVINGLQVTLK